MANQRTVLVVGNPGDTRAMLSSVLAAGANYRVRSVTTVAEATATVLGRDSRIDAVLLDAELPDGCGYELCLRLRQHGVRIPIIMLTETGAEEEVVAGLDSGANDCVGKPYREGELLARLRAQFRTFESSDDVAYRIGPFLFRPATRTLQDPTSSRRIRLTDKEAAVLRFLCRAEGRAVSRQTLLREVWGYHPSADSHTVETHIYRLRRKLELETGRVRMLTNVGGGYRLVDEDAEIAMGARMHPGAMAIQHAA
ncbi:MAG: response regulator transcription factor [Acidisphaera sp.]|nr:response regulator transcription factor [Acidisphaera sp.]MBV9811460.1 response regulator transcription factor [Acetobacteraceae bacterium]